MIMPIRRPMPPEHNRRWVTLPGRVADHRILDRRSSFTRWLGRTFPATQSFIGGFHHMLEIELDPDARVMAGEMLRVRMLDNGTQTIPPSITYEVMETKLCEYPVGTLVGVSFGISNEIDQWFGCQPVRCDVKLINELGDLNTMPGAVLPRQGALV
jgi:hypothetical protein